MPSPYAGLTDSTETISNYLYVALCNTASTLGLYTGNPKSDGTPNSVWYGDQGLLPVTPAVCVVPGPETSAYQGVGGRPVLMEFQTFIMVYYGKIQDAQQNTHQSLILANTIKHLFNQDFTLGGNVIDTFCSNIDPGVAVRMGALMDATRMAYRSRSKVTLNA